MTEKNSDAKAGTAPKAARPRKAAQDVDAMVTEVAAAAKVKAPKAAPAEAKAAPKTVEPKAAPKPAEPKAVKTIVIRQVRSGICTPVDQKLTLQALGLRRIRHEVTRPDTAALRGQVRKVRHLVVVVGE
jgi:large subunit ribosomal protein L30